MHRAGVVGLVDAVAEAHEPVAALDRVAQPRLGLVDRCRSRRACRARGSARRRAAAPTARRSRRRPPAARSAPVDVIDAGGERRRVEAVVDRRDQVLLDRPRVLGRRHLAAASCRGSWRRTARSGCGSIGSSPCWSRYSAVSSVGTTAHTWSACGAQLGARRRRATAGSRASTPSSETVVRSMSSGGASRPPARAIVGSTRLHRRPGSRGAARSRRGTRRAGAATGSSPSNRRYHTSSSVRFSASSTASYWR